MGFSRTIRNENAAGVPVDAKVRIRPRTRRERIGWLVNVLTEHVFLLLALVILIPPVRSIEGQTFDAWYRVFPIMSAFLLLSRGCAIRRGDESWVGVALKLLVFVAFGVALREVSTMW